MSPREQTIKLQKWILNNFEDWNTICGIGRYPIGEQEFLRLMHCLVEDGFEEITLVLFHCHYYAVQARMERKIRFLAKNYGEALRRHGIDSEDLLRSLCDETSADDPASQDRN